MKEIIKNALGAKPHEALGAVIGCWFVATVILILAEVFNLYDVNAYRYVIFTGETILWPTGFYYFITLCKGVPNWWMAKKEIDEKREVIRSLSVAAKDFLWTILVRNRRTIEVAKMNSELYDHYIVAPRMHDYQITRDYWPLLWKEWKTLLYQGKHKPSNSWEDTLKLL